MARTTEMDQRPEVDFQSFLAPAIKDYLDYLDHLGFRVVTPAYALARIDRFLVEHHVDSFDQHDPRRVMAQLVHQYQGRFKTQTFEVWQRAFRGLCRYLALSGAKMMHLRQYFRGVGDEIGVQTFIFSLTRPSSGFRLITD
jgi:hypothetical protein